MFYYVYLLIYLMFIYDSVKKTQNMPSWRKPKKKEKKKIGALLETKSVTLKLHENFKYMLNFAPDSLWHISFEGEIL